MSLFSRHPLFVRKGFIVFQNYLFVIISLLATLEKCYVTDFFLSETLISLFFIRRFILFGVGFKLPISEPTPSINCLP